MKWKKTEIDGYPTEDQQCLVILKNQKYIQALSWNDHYQSWDDLDGDDHAFDKEEVIYWMEFPMIPEELHEKNNQNI
jgi:hypothetical protein